MGFAAIAVEAGVTVTRALDRVSRAGTGRLCTELAHAIAEVDLGRSLDEALVAAADRMAHPTHRGRAGECVGARLHRRDIEAAMVPADATAGERRTHVAHAQEESSGF